MAATAPTTLQYALLGLLARRPLTGYEILKRFNRSVVFFWHAKQSQIYAELKRMERLGLVTSRLEVQWRRPNRRYYAMTPAGEAALRGWVDARTPVGPVKDEMLLRTFFSDRLPPAHVAARLRRHGDEHDRVLCDFEAIKAGLEARYGSVETTSDLPLVFRYLVLEQGIRFERMYAEWCRWAADTLERRRARPGPASSSPSGADFIVTTAR